MSNWIDDLLQKVQGAITALQSGTSKPIRSKWNFIGATIADNPSEERLDITISGASPSSSLPQNIGTGAAGSSAAYSRADHVHAHGNQAGGLRHAQATGSVDGFMSAADKTTFDAATPSSTASVFAKRDVDGSCAFRSALTVDDGSDNQVGIYDAPQTSIASGIGLWQEVGQLRSVDENEVEFDLTSRWDAQGYADKFGVIRIHDRVGQILAVDGVDTYVVVGIPAAQLPSGNWVAQMWVDWLAFDVTDGTKYAIGTVRASVKCVSGTLAVFTSRGSGQEIGAIINGTSSVDTATDKPGVMVDLRGSGDIAFVITLLSSNHVRATARMRDFIIFQHE